MNFFARFIAISLCITFAMSATSTWGSFSSTAQGTATTGASAVLYTNGWMVTLTAAGWIYGDSIPLAAAATSTTWSTLISFSGLTGIGVVGICSTPVPVSYALLTGKGADTCPADIATVYTGAATGTTTKLPDPATGTNNIAAGGIIKWVLTAPATIQATSLTGISSTLNGGTAAVSSSATAAVGSSGGAAQYALSTITYGFYVQTATSAQVCFQSDTQHTNNVACGTAVVKSANIFSAAITGFVSMIALIFFN